MDTMDFDNKLIELGELCAGMKIELTGIKEVLETLTGNQTEIIRLREKGLYVDEALSGVKQDVKLLFVITKNTEQIRAEERIENLECSQKWLTRGALGAVMVGTIGALIKVFIK